jgi:hypothetical protein
VFPAPALAAARAWAAVLAQGRSGRAGDKPFLIRDKNGVVVPFRLFSQGAYHTRMARRCRRDGSTDFRLPEDEGRKSRFNPAKQSGMVHK